MAQPSRHKSPPVNQHSAHRNRRWAKIILAAHAAHAAQSALLESYSERVEAIKALPELEHQLSMAITQHRNALAERNANATALKAEVTAWVRRHKEDEPNFESRNFIELRTDPGPIAAAAAELLEVVPEQASFYDAMRTAIEPLLDAANEAIDRAREAEHTRRQANEARRELVGKVERLRSPYRAALIHLLGEKHELVRALRLPIRSTSPEAEASAVNLVVDDGKEDEANPSVDEAAA